MDIGELTGDNAPSTWANRLALGTNGGSVPYFMVVAGSGRAPEATFGGGGVLPSNYIFGLADSGTIMLEETRYVGGVRGWNTTLPSHSLLPSLPPPSPSHLPVPVFLPPSSSPRLPRPVFAEQAD